MITKLMVGGTVGALVLDSTDTQVGVYPVSDTEAPLQVLLMKRLAGTAVAKHGHSKQVRETQTRQKALVLIRGSINVQMCDENGVDGDTYTLQPGQCLYLITGGYALTMAEDAVFFEFKNGPHTEDKVLFH